MYKAVVHYNEEEKYFSTLEEAEAYAINQERKLSVECVTVSAGQGWEPLSIYKEGIRIDIE